MNPARLFFIFVATVVGPAVAVWIFTMRVFPDSAGPATIMLSIAVLIAATFTWKSKDATPRTRQYCLWAHFAICVALCVNLGGHWLMAREVTAARQGVVERHTEEDRAEDRRAKEHARQMQIREAEADLIARETKRAKAEAWRLSQLPRDQRRSAMRPSPETMPAPEAPTPAIAAVEVKQPGEGKAPRLTPEEVVEKWIMFLTVMAFVDCFMSVGAGALLGVVWEWDRNHDGIPDHLQAPIIAAVAGAVRQIQESRPTAPALIEKTAQAPPVSTTRHLSSAPQALNGAQIANGAPSGKSRPAWWHLWRRQP